MSEFAEKSDSGKIRFPVLMEPRMKALIRAALPDPDNEKVAPYLLRLVREDIVRRVENGELDAAGLLRTWEDAASMAPSGHSRPGDADSGLCPPGNPAPGTPSRVDPLITSLRNLRDGRPAALENPAAVKAERKRTKAERRKSSMHSAPEVPEACAAEPVPGTRLQILHLP